MFRRYDSERDFSIPLILGLVGAGIGFLLYCWLFMMMWKLGKSSPEYDRYHDIFSFIGYPSELLISMLCKMHLMHREDFLAVLAVIGAWYTFLGFLFGFSLYFLIELILSKFTGGESGTNK